jgi:hypothetical protein
LAPQLEKHLPCVHVPDSQSPPVAHSAPSTHVGVHAAQRFAVHTSVKQSPAPVQALPVGQLGEHRGVSHVPALHTLPPVQLVAPAQQACPLAPQATHAPPAAGHTSAPALQDALAATHFVSEGSQQPPLVHAPPEQHTSPVAPQSSHLPAEHTLPVAHGVAPAQHASLVAPHATHAPPVAGHTSVPPLQVALAATHFVVEGSQQPPLVHAPPEQQASPVAPQAPASEASAVGASETASVPGASDSPSPVGPSAAPSPGPPSPVVASLAVASEPASPPSFGAWASEPASPASCGLVPSDAV